MSRWWSSRSFRARLLVVAAAALALRVVYILLTNKVWVAQRNEHIWGDAYAYHWSGRLLASGHGFIQPLPWNAYRIVLHSADRPPGYIVFLAFLSVLGLKSFMTHQLLTAVMGAGTVVLAGLVGKEIAGERVGLVAATLAAVYPNIWMHDGMVMSETMTIFTVTLVLLVAYRFMHAPSGWRAVAFGAGCGLAALTHPDSSLFVPLVGLPMVVWLKGVDWRRKLLHLVLVGGTALAVVAPWLVRNLVQFEKPVTLSTGLDVTLAVSNCDQTFHGREKGYWDFSCITSIPEPHGDLSERAVVWRHHALDYIGNHKGELVGVEAARLGRTWGVYRPLQMIRFDNKLEGHDLAVVWAAYVMYVMLVPLAIGGIVVMRRRRLPLFPLLAGPVTVTIATLMTFGNTRYRAAAEISLVLAAAVALVALVERRRPHEPVVETVRPASGEEPTLTGVTS